MKKKKRFVLFSVIVFVILILFLLQKLLTPKYMSGILEGALIAEYYKETTPHDVLFIGDCEVYESATRC